MPVRLGQSGYQGDQMSDFTKEVLDVLQDRYVIFDFHKIFHGFLLKRNGENVLLEILEGDLEIMITILDSYSSIVVHKIQLADPKMLDKIDFLLWEA